MARVRARFAVIPAVTVAVDTLDTDANVLTTEPAIPAATVAVADDVAAPSVLVTLPTGSLATVAVADAVTAPSVLDRVAVLLPTTVASPWMSNPSSAIFTVDCDP